MLDRERDPLAAEFAALRTAVVSRPPGVAAARRTVRRRRQRVVVGAASLAVVVLAALGVAVAGFAAPPGHRSAPRPAADPVPSTGAPSLAPAAPPVLPGPSRPASAGAAPAVSSGAACTRYGAVVLDTPKQTSVTVRVDQDGPYPLCPGERVRVFVATYSVDSTGGQHLYKSVTGTLDAAHNPLTLPLQVPPCHVTVYVISGNQQVKSALPAMSDFPKQAPAAYYSAAAGPYGGVVWLQEEDPCAGARQPAIPN